MGLEEDLSTGYGNVWVSSEASGVMHSRVNCPKTIGGQFQFQEQKKKVGDFQWHRAISINQFYFAFSNQV